MSGRECSPASDSMSPGSAPLPSLATSLQIKEPHPSLASSCPPQGPTASLIGGYQRSVGEARPPPSSSFLVFFSPSSPMTLLTLLFLCDPRKFPNSHSLY